ncbi:MAG: glutamine synthetase, partial [Cyanobacteria bacterium P01_D01_bin.2]
PSEEDASLMPFPKTLDRALEALGTDCSMQDLLGKEFCQLFSTVKAFELARFHDHITDWEVAEYLEVY